MSFVMKGKITDVRELENISKKVRIHILHMLTQSGSGHTGGSLSAADVAVAIYFSKMNFNPEDPNWRDRDMFGCSGSSDDLLKLRGISAENIIDTIKSSVAK